MKTKLLSLALLATACIFGQVSIGIRIGPPPPPRVVRVLPARPGPDYVWIDGYWFVDGGRYRWHAGYWTLPPYPGARWIVPHHDGERFFAGYWDGDRGRFEHDHHWDRERERDRDRWRDHDDHGHDRH